MKRNYLIIALLLLFCGTEAKNTIHWITFFDTTDNRVDALGRQIGIGEMDVNVRKLLYGHWINVVNAALAPKGYKSDIHDYYGDNTSPEKCKAVLKNFVCDTTDIVVFYYQGHGARSRYDSDPYPQCCFAQTDEKKYITLSSIHEELLKQHPRLTITIGMCCNAVDETVSPKQGIAFAPNKGAAYAAIDEVSNIQKLFLENRGDIIVAACEPGQIAVGWEINSTIGLMDIFSLHLIADFAREVKDCPTPDWENLLGNVQNDVDEYAAKNGHIQSPIYTPNIVSVPQPKVVKDTERPVPRPTSDHEKYLNALTGYFDLVILPDFSSSIREGFAGEIKSLFAKNAKIKILAQSRDMVIDQETPETFLDRISFTKRLLKVIATDVDMNNGKIQTLWVREHYIK